MTVKIESVVNLLDPLEPLSTQEIKLAVEIINKEKSFTSSLNK